MSAGDKVKVVLVGTGGWGRQHARVFSQHPDIDFRAIAARNPERTAARAAEYGVSAYTDVVKMLEREKPDLVSVCLPNQEHYAVTLQIIDAGYPLLVEKPLTFELSEADALLAAAADRELFFAINFNHRYAKPVAMAKQAIESGNLGEIVYATWQFGGDGPSGHPHANLIETQCHGFDQLEYLCGPIASIMAEMTDKTGGGFRTVILSLRFANDAIGSLVGSYDTSYAYTDTHRVEVNGTAGRIVIDDTVRGYSFQAIGSETAEVWQAGYFNDFDREFLRTFDIHLDAIIKAFQAGEQPPIHARAGRRALHLAYAAISSYETGRRVMVTAA